ncbi:DUF2341 domain-containing protein [Agromyces silvae]|uniref:DUF2341 domain-containing protein n=1 Tax=Agromyces silvae TaxID=3388266 RepID=UPI00280BAC24|nr:DUF2341 domain-containing protein [Agromyces protaetiae]
MTMIRARARSRWFSLFVTATVGTALIATGGLASVAAAVELGLDGDGSTRSPYQIGSAADLRVAADAINSDPAGFAGATYRLTADIDFSGETFAGIDTFRGVFDGAGHVIRDIVYGPSATGGSTGGRLGFFRSVTDATVRNLTLDGIVADSGSRTDWVSGLTVLATRSTITGNTVSGATLTAASGEKAAGLIAEMDGGVTSDNRVQADITANKMAGGVASYSKNSVTISNNLVEADLTVVVDGQGGTRGVDAAMIANYPGNPSGDSRFTGNVAYAGSIDYRGAVDGFAGRIVGYTGYGGWTATDNLANSAITVGGSTVTGPGTKNQHGEDRTAEQLAERSTYEALGWDFASAWRFDDVLGHPVPSYTYALLGDGTPEVPFEIGSEEDLEFLAAQLNAGNPRYTGEKTYALTTDLDFADRAEWPGIDRFEGVLEGNGRRIANLVYGPGGAGAQLGFIRQLHEATVRDLVLDGVTADQGTGTQFVAGLAVVSTRSTITGTSVIDAHLRGPAAEKVSGLVAEMDGGLVSGNWTKVSASADRMPGGLVSYSKNGAVISENLVEAELTVGRTGGTRGDNAGFVISYPGNPGNGSSFTGNVAYAGSIAYGGRVDGFAGRIVGYTDLGGWTATDNVGNAAITIGGSPVTGPGVKNQHGADRTGEQLADRSTYEGLGWDFGENWRWDDALGHPVPRFILPGELPNRVTTTFHGDGATARAFTWYSTLVTDTAVVRLSTDREFPEGASTVDHGATADTSRHGERLYRAVVQDLAPGTRYHYRLGDPVNGVWSTTGSFVTAGTDEDFTFIGLTDTQSQNLAEAQLSAATMSKAFAAVPEAEFMVHSGDLVEQGAREQDWIDLLGSARDTLLNTTIAPAAGNHEEADDSFTDHFTLEAPNGQDTRRGAYYSFGYNDAHFMVLNTNEDGATNQQGAQAISDAQVEWLRQDALAAREAGAKWLVLSLHKGPYTTANHLDDWDVVAMRKVLMPVIDEVGVDLVLQGHDHVMSRTKVLGYDPEGIEQARVVETTKYTEIINGKRIEYNVDPDGTIFLLPNTAGAKHYAQKGSARGFDLEQYLQLFDRTGAQATENFVAVRVTDDQLTVDVYDIRNQSSPRVFESFGIDRSLAPVEASISGLPALDELTLSDEVAVGAAREAVDALRPGQRQAVGGLAALAAAEQRMRELTGRVSTDGSVVAWAKSDAEHRQAITVRNDTRSSFSDVPVQVRIEDTPDVSAESLAFVDANGVPLPYEVETWRPGHTSTVWVRATELPAESAAVLWAYYGGGETANDPTRVWAGDYALVEHFGEPRRSGDTVVDSTGTASGTLVGADLDAVVSDRGTGQTRFEGSRLQYPGDIGGDFDRISISGVYALTAGDIAALTGNAPIVAKESATGDGRTTFWQGVVKNESRLGTRLAGNSFEFNDADVSSRHDAPADGAPHLVTQVYDGMTYSVFIDGREVHSQMLEYRTTFSDHRVRTTIGDYDTSTGALSSPFRGTIDEIQIAGVAFTPEFESFRYANYLGDAVSLGERISRDGDAISLIIGTPTTGAEVEAGLVEFAGSVSHRATVTARVAGEEVVSERVDAGVFRLPVPVDPIGDQEVELTATADGGSSAPARVRLAVTDTAAPAQPELDDTSSSAGRGEGIELTATPRTESLERVDVEFFAEELLALDASNTVVRSGATTDRVPTALTPQSGTVTGELFSRTAAENANPFQIYEISLTEQQAEQDRFHVVWRGSGDDRRVSAWVYDHAAGAWRLKASDADEGGAAIELDVEAYAGEGAVSNERTMHVLVWRGLTAEPFGEDHDYEREPAAADYDWAFDHIPDTQLYTQATPHMFEEQMAYVVDRAPERKTSIVVHAGDLVNRKYLSQEYQWVNAERGMSKLDEAGIPYLVSWGNHDYENDRNNRVMLPKYYPMSRMAESLEGSPWTFGGSNNIDNSYYTAEIEGAKIMLLTVGFFSADQAGDEGLAWARNIIAEHPDHAVIIAAHQSVDTGANRWANQHLTSQLIDPFPNVKLVLGGHITGTGVASRTAAEGALVYGILTDYQGRVYGGQQYLRSLSVDAENGLLYANTYSPYLDARTSDGPWRQPIAEGAIPGFHGSDSENFVLELDFGGSTTRTLETSSLIMAAGEATRIGPSQGVVGATAATVILEGVRPETAYGWYAELRDGAGHVTRSTTRTIQITAAEAPSAPLDVVATGAGGTVTVSWSAPEDDGGAPVTQYEVRLSDGTIVTVDAGVRTAAFTGLAPGIYSATVFARNAAGLSEGSAPSNEVELVADPGEDPEANAALRVTGDLVPGGRIVVHGTGFAPNTAYALEFRSAVVDLGSVTADEAGAFTTTVTVPTDTAPGAHSIAAVRDGVDIAAIQLQIAPASEPGGEPGGQPGDGGGAVPDGSASGGGLSGHLPETGSDSGRLVVGALLAGMLLLAGMAMLLVRRRARVGWES